MQMEDEESEMFNDDFLNDLKRGNDTSPVGRNSVRFSELKFRNSMVPHHLRSTYIAQYGDQNYSEDDLKVSDHKSPLGKTFSIHKSNPDLSRTEFWS